MSKIFKINPDIRKAETLSSLFYTNEKYFCVVKRKNLHPNLTNYRNAKRNSKH
ncbi:MAG: hypothetical protein M3405_02750 [Acidobacteriota bacterium]|nr:hypothetical protein [Acidobacteriota bacterium]